MSYCRTRLIRMTQPVRFWDSYAGARSPVSLVSRQKPAEIVTAQVKHWLTKKVNGGGKKQAN